MNRKSAFRSFTWLWALSPTVMGLLIVLLLVEFQLIEFNFSIHDIDTFILFVGLLITILFSSALLSRTGIHRIQIMSEKQSQDDFAADRARFLRRLDHEIKNPLMGIQTALDNLIDTPEPEQRRLIRTAIDEQIRRLTRLVADLRRIGDMEHHEIEMLPVDTNLLLEDAFGMLSDEELATKRNLELNIRNPLPNLTGDYDLLLLALHNILNNAIKYTAEGDKISLTAFVDDLNLKIMVTDSGPGIASEDLPYIWDELYRSKYVKDIPGSGIGLALVWRIIERHKGRVIIDSSPDRGTRVEISLPLNINKD